ncbi:MAG TPA: hypothetical protein VF214_05650, partial [Edaphobacter sp.]
GLAEEVPYNVQMLAHSCWNDLRDHAGRRAASTLNAGIVEGALKRLVRQYDPFYTQIWSSLTSIQQKTLIAVIQEQGVNLQSASVSQFVGSGASTVQRAVGALTDRSVLREEEKQGGVRMRFEDPFFAQWILAFTASSSRMAPFGVVFSPPT